MPRYPASKFPVGSGLFGKYEQTVMFNPWLAFGGLLFFLAALGTSFYEGTVWEAGKNASSQLAVAQTALKQFQNTADNIANQAHAFQGTQAGLKSDYDKIAKDLHNVQAKHPLPPDCKPTADRMQSIGAAVDRANAATGQ